MTTEDNGNLPSSQKLSSTEDLSEYTDADESISAPTEILAEFLSSVMLKDYETALKYCKLILHYEPKNATAIEFYPLILERLQENSSADNSGEDNSDDDGSSNSSDEEAQDEEEDDEEGEDSSSSEDDDDGEENITSSKRSSSDATSASSYSSLEEEEEEEVVINLPAENEEDDEEELEEARQLAELVARYNVDNEDLGNGNSLLNTKNSILNFDANVAAMASSDSESSSEQKRMAQELRARVLPLQK